jgi:hypothetical protein
MSTTDRVERKLATILTAEVQGYRRLMGAAEGGTLRMLTASREVTDTRIQPRRGRIVSTAQIMRSPEPRLSTSIPYLTLPAVPA